jgi:hypothetical protein
MAAGSNSVGLSGWDNVDLAGADCNGFSVDIEIHLTIKDQ